MGREAKSERAEASKWRSPFCPFAAALRRRAALFSHSFQCFFYLSKTTSQAYEELGKLGEGTYGTVLRCRHRGTKELVAVKRFKESAEENQVRRVEKFFFPFAAADES